jgi:hypothetical protein
MGQWRAIYDRFGGAEQGCPKLVIPGAEAGGIPFDGIKIHLIAEQERLHGIQVGGARMHGRIGDRAHDLTTWVGPCTACVLPQA